MKEAEKFTNKREIKQYTPDNQCIKEEIEGKFENILKQIKMGTQYTNIYNTCGMQIQRRLQKNTRDYYE